MLGKPTNLRVRLPNKSGGAHQRKETKIGKYSGRTLDKRQTGHYNKYGKSKSTQKAEKRITRTLSCSEKKSFGCKALTKGLGANLELRGENAALSCVKGTKWSGREVLRKPDNLGGTTESKSSSQFGEGFFYAFSEKPKRILIEKKGTDCMKWTGLNELRESFLSFFESKGHTRLKSFPLVPQGDNSLLLINSGMAPMKKYFLGQETPPNKRVTTCQKCIRTPDIERVGKTSRHGTYFEMLGNFSFGDYFKHEATAWAWEFITKKLELPVDRIWVSIYEDDEETRDIWVNEVGVSPDHIVRLGREDNFWEIGSGPCGPCSELYFDRGPDKGCGRPDCKVGCDCDRYVEFWNLVFSQFNSDGEGHYEPMAHPNIDTGMGLERLACIMQEVDNLFEVDTVQNIMKHICRIAGVTYKENEETDISLRVITDHIRSTTFMIADGVIPSNEGKGYVLRRLLRRAARHGKLLGISEPFLYKVVDTVASENAAAYPELVEKAEYIKKLIRTEEENFAKTIDKGIELLNHLIEDVTRSGKKVIDGADAFRLYDTYGFPVDLMEDIIGDRDIKIDEEGFMLLMEAQKQRAREARFASDSIIGWADSMYDFLDDQPTEFVGYDVYECEAQLKNIIVEGEEQVAAGAGQPVVLVFDTTPFYAESGGQVADKGIFTYGDVVVSIEDCQKLPGGQYLHIGEVKTGVVEKGRRGQLKINIQRREATMRNHTAAHLLQKALRDVLGDHVHQAGQLVTPERVRFDFNHFSAMTPEQLHEVEDAVNAKILEALSVKTIETDLETAHQMGAMALFGEKYGDVVRMVNAGDYSIELCGGTHVDNTAKLGLFKIISENSVAAGIRRIEGATGAGVLELLSNMQCALAGACSAMKVANPAELAGRCKTVVSELREAEKKITELRGELAEIRVGNLFADATNVRGIRVVSVILNNATPDALRAMGDKAKANNPDLIAVFASVMDGKGNLLAVCGKEAVKRGAHAGNIVKEVAALAGGKGGGRPDSAMAGVSQIFQIDEALTQLTSIVEKYIKD